MQSKKIRNRYVKDIGSSVNKFEENKQTIHGYESVSEIDTTVKFGGEIYDR
jgi:hypothetical protein